MGRWNGKACRLTVMLSMTMSFFLVELIVGNLTNSLALVADSFHMLSDVVALVVGLISVRISRRGQSKNNTFGWARAEVLGAMVNAVFLIALCFTILVDAIQRLISPEAIEDVVMLLIVGGIGLLVNLVGLALFHNQAHGHSHGGGGGHGHSHSGHGHSHGHNRIKKDQQETQALHSSLKEDNASSDDENIDEQSTGKEIKQLVTQLDGSVKEIRLQEDPKQASAQQLNMRGVFLHVLGDALGSVIVMISGLMYMFIPCAPDVTTSIANATENLTTTLAPVNESSINDIITCMPKPDWVLYIDPILSLILVTIILSTSVPLLRDSGMILLQTVPTHIVVANMQSEIEKIDGILAIHEFHVWSLAGNKIVASLHLHLRSLEDYVRISNKVKEYFHEEGIHSVTIQPEFLDLHVRKAGRDCVLECGPDKDCHTDTCCGTKKTLTPTNNSKPMDTNLEELTVVVASNSGTPINEEVSRT